MKLFSDSTDHQYVFIVLYLYNLTFLITSELTFGFQGDLHSGRVLSLKFLEHRFIHRYQFSTDLSIVLVFGQPALTQEVVSTNSSIVFERL